MSPISLADLISSRKWEHAFFTTYALSLTFFETCVLRELRQKGCHQIYLITDVDGYQSSLGERRSTRVGHEYRVIPVALPKGVFHPKCTYLSGPEGDVLIIGSGNITFGGYGRNLEVFEVLEPGNTPTIFGEFADFLDDLGTRADIIIPDNLWITQLSLLARRHAQNSISDPSQPRLLHSASYPIIDQIVKLAAQEAKGSVLTVLSPFHDADGNAVKRLAERLGAAEIRVALPTRKPSETTFPFKEAGSWSIPLSAVIPEVESPNRCLHAKWFQIERSGSETITLTGSINATSKALCSNDNIEVGIFRRHSPEVEYATWKKTLIPKNTATPHYGASGLGNKCVIHAVLRSDGSFAGWVIKAKDVAGTWDGFLESGKGDRCAVSAIVNDDGRFISTLSSKEELLFATGLQIFLTKEGCEARGWVTQEDILKLGREQRTVIRFLNDEDTLDDEVALIDYLALSINRHSPQFVNPIKIHKQEGKTDGRDAGHCSVTFHLADIAPIEGNSGDEEEISSPESHTGAFDLFVRLRRYLLGERPTSQNKTKIVEIEYEEEDEDPGVQKEEAAKRRKIISRLDAFEDCVEKCLQESKDVTRRRAALVYWFEVKLHILMRHNLHDEALIFLRAWFWHACSEKLMVSPYEALEQHLFTAAAVCALALPDESRPLDLVKIHGGLERFFGGVIEPTLVHELLIDHPEVGFASFLVPSQENMLGGALDDILKTTTLRSELETSLARHEAHLEVNSDLNVFKSSIGKEFLSTLKKRPGVKCYKASDPVTPCCRFCYTVLTVKAEHDFKHNRIAQCSHCGMFVVNLEP